jgi:hypothetical protein
MVLMDGILNFHYFAPFRDGEEQNAENPIVLSLILKREKTDCRTALT